MDTSKQKRTRPIPQRPFWLALALALVGAAAAAYGMGIGTGPRHHGSQGGMRHMMGPPPSAGENPVTATDAVIAQGNQLYDANCSACHGPQGRGDGPAAAGLSPRPPDLLGTSASWSDGQLAAQIQQGRGSMPPFSPTLDDNSIWSIVHYVRRLQR